MYGGTPSSSPGHLGDLQSPGLAKQQENIEIQTLKKKISVLEQENSKLRLQMDDAESRTLQLQRSQTNVVLNEDRNWMSSFGSTNSASR